MVSIVFLARETTGITEPYRMWTWFTSKAVLQAELSVGDSSCLLTRMAQEGPVSCPRLRADVRIFCAAQDNFLPLQTLFRIFLKQVL